MKTIIFTIIVILTLNSCTKESGSTTKIKRKDSSGSYNATYLFNGNKAYQKFFINNINEDLYAQFFYNDTIQLYQKMKFTNTTEFNIDMTFNGIVVKSSQGKIKSDNIIEINYINDKGELNSIIASKEITNKAE